ncbi:MAG: transposase [Deinococcales bacterium]
MRGAKGKEKGKWYINLQLRMEDERPQTPKGSLGVDLGMSNLAVSSEGQVHSSEHLQQVRGRYTRLKSELQSVGTKSAKRKLQKLSGKEKRFRRDVNHGIAKELVETAKRTQRGLKLEDLKGIRKGAKAKGKSFRKSVHGWSFYQLREFIHYRCERYGVVLALVEAKYTSQTCSCCGHRAKESRKSQARFECVQCGYRQHADINAAINISRADVKQPMVGSF